MIYDCFIFGSELELLEVRFSFLNSEVDFFVIVESSQTLTGLKKDLIFRNNRNRFCKYLDKVIYLECPPRPEMNGWQYEFYQREFIKNGLNNCSDNDIIMISDVDEIINVSEILGIKNLNFPVLVALPTYYYFFNLKSKYAAPVNLIGEYSFIKSISIGQRLPNYPLMVKNVIKSDKIITGWHFSFLFGFDTLKYKNKIISFSHQEYNTSYYLNDERIRKCIELGIDFFERGGNMYRFYQPEKCLGVLFSHIKQAGLENYLYIPSKKHFWTISALKYLVTKKYLPRLVYLFKYNFKKAAYPLLLPVWRIFKRHIRKNYF